MDERIAFGPKALSRFTNIIEEVAVELGDDGVLLRSTEMRTRLAQRLFGLARFWWTDTQIKQLLLRTLRNEASASRITRPRELSRNHTAKKFRQNNTTVTIT
jgi:hypothetical protein